MSPIKVAIHGATGRMGTETVNAVCREDDLTLVGATCNRDRGGALALPAGGEVPLSTSLEEILGETKPDVVVDFTNAAVCRESVAVAAAHSCSIVVGVRGMLRPPALCRQVQALEHERNQAQARINWRFGILDAQTKRHRLYPINS